MSNDHTRPLPPHYGYPGRPLRRRNPARKKSVITLVSVVVLLVVLVIADRVGRQIAQNQFASQAQQAGLGVRPTVDITGFPFLTQLAARDFTKVTFSAHDVPAGPLKISSINATATGVHVNSSFNGATVDHMTGTGLVTYQAIGNALSGGSGIVKVSPAGHDQLKVDAGPVSQDAAITRTGTNKISVEVENNGSILGGILNSLGSFSFTVPDMPAGMRVTSLSTTGQGLVMTFSASHTPFSQ
ncbi:MAG: DUF2993 domain-containing protein [Streptosporangiales bacterium]|nr:DUF2993 domain-containing protein [Streptosporangiales bacterium]